MIVQRARPARQELEGGDEQASKQKMMHMDGNHLSPREPAGWKIFSKVRWIGVVIVLLSLVPMIIGMAHFQGLMRPQNLALREFDSVFRRVGSLFPFFVLLLRALGTCQHQEWAWAHCPNLRVFRLWDTLWIYAGFQLLRLVVYFTHLIVQKSHLEEGGQLMSDHAVLAISVQSSLTIEVAVTTHLVITAVKTKRSSAVFFLSACVAWVLLVLTSLDMYNTARYFHDLSDSFTAMMAGSGLFVFPAIGLLLMPSSSLGGTSELTPTSAPEELELASQRE